MVARVLAYRPVVRELPKISRSRDLSEPPALRPSATTTRLRKTSRVTGRAFHDGVAYVAQTQDERDEQRSIVRV